MNKPFSKGHDPATLRAAIASGLQTDFNAITLTGIMKLVSPQAALAPWADGWAPVHTAPPEDDSRQTAAELLEVALASRVIDRPFHAMGIPPLVPPGAIDPLAAFGADHKGPGLDAMAFRYDRTHTGPYVSQFLLRPVPMGANAAVLQQTVRLRNGRYGVTVATRDAILAGNVPEPQAFSPTGSYVFSPRALASYVHQDPPYLFGLQAALILDGMKAPRSTMFPTLPNETGFVTYGGAVDLQCAIAEVCRVAMKWAWNIKLLYNRRRPEELFRDQASLHPEWHQIATPWVAPLNGCLPLVYAEGAPGHADYPSGHAVIGGACATLLKGWYADGVMNQPVQSTNGAALTPYSGAALTIHGELDKMAANMGWGRNFAGIHLRSSCAAGMEIGEQVAIRYLETMGQRCHEQLGTVTFRRFNGQPVFIDA